MQSSADWISLVYIENRKKISQFDQDVDKGDKGIFIWRKPGKLVPADSIKDFTVSPTNDAFKENDSFKLLHYFQRPEEFVAEEGYYKQHYSMEITVKVLLNNEVRIIYGPRKNFKRKYISINNSTENKIKYLRNYPNPFMETTTIEFKLPVDGQVYLEFLDLQGKLVETINGYYTAGDHSLEVNLKGKVQTGVYLYRMRTSGFIDTRLCVVR